MVQTWTRVFSVTPERALSLGEQPCGRGGGRFLRWSKRVDCTGEWPRRDSPGTRTGTKTFSESASVAVQVRRPRSAYLKSVPVEVCMPKRYGPQKKSRVIVDRSRRMAPKISDVEFLRELPVNEVAFEKNKLNFWSAGRAHTPTPWWLCQNCALCGPHEAHEENKCTSTTENAFSWKQGSEGSPACLPN